MKTSHVWATILSMLIIFWSFMLHLLIDWSV